MNTFRIRVVGTAEIDGSIDDTKDYSIAYKRLGVRKVEKTPLEDGYYQYTYVLENLDELTLIGEDKIRIGKTKKDSQRLRATCWHYNQDEEFYHKFVSRLIHPDNFEKVLQILDLEENVEKSQ